MIFIIIIIVFYCGSGSFSLTTDAILAYRSDEATIKIE